MHTGINILIYLRYICIELAKTCDLSKTTFLMVGKFVKPDVVSLAYKFEPTGIFFGF